MKRAPSSRDAPKDDYEPKHIGGSLLIPPSPSASPRVKVSPMLTRGGSATNLLSSSPPAGGSVITSGQAAWATKRQDLASLQLDKSKVMELQDSLQQSQELTNKLVGIMNSFEGRLSSLEDGMASINNRTNQLKSIYSNVDDTIASMQHMLDVLSTARRVESVIDQGLPTKFLVPYLRSDRIDLFVKYMHEIAEGITYLQANVNFKSAESALSKLQHLQRLAVAKTEDALSFLISENSAPLDLMDALPEAKLETIERGKQIYAPWPEDMIKNMQKIVLELQQQKQYNYQRTYKEYRAQFLTQTLQSLNLDQVIYAGRPSKSVEDMKASSGQVVVPQTSGRDYVRGSHKYLYFVRVFLILLQYERKLATELIDPTYLSSVYSGIFENGLDLFITTGESIIKFQKTSDRVFGVFPLFDIWERLSASLEAFQAALKVGGKPNEDLTDFATQLSSSLRRSFLEFEEDLTHDTLKGVPTDGTVSELTSNALHYLKRVLEYRQVVDSVLPPPASTQKQSGTPFGDLITRILKALLTNLEDKADKVRKKEKALANIFILNNAYYVSANVNNSELSSHVEAKFSRYLQDVLTTERNTYKESWEKAVENLKDDEDEDFAKKKQASLSSKQKKKLKAKYSGFNSEVEELIAAQKRFTIYDEELCEQLRSDIRAVVLGPYKKFLALHEASTFTANPGKYIKYTPETLETIINNFYEGQAVQKASKKGFHRKK